MKLPEKLKAAKITYAGAPPAELSLGEEARTINALIDYLEDYIERDTGELAKLAGDYAAFKGAMGAVVTTMETYTKELEERAEIVTNDLLARVYILEQKLKGDSYFKEVSTAQPRTITILKPEWWEGRGKSTLSNDVYQIGREIYSEALTACSEASGVKFTLED